MLRVKDVHGLPSIKPLLISVGPFERTVSIALSEKSSVRGPRIVSSKSSDNWHIFFGVEKVWPTEVSRVAAVGNADEDVVVTLGSRVMSITRLIYS